jgi:hypothetical protein
MRHIFALSKEAAIFQFDSGADSFPAVKRYASFTSLLS